MAKKVKPTKTKKKAAAAPKPASKPAREAAPKSKKSDRSGQDDASGGVTAEHMAKRQREISVSEFFTKNRHLLGFDNPRKALLTAIKEAVDNSLDACEEARILPEVNVVIKKMARENTYTISIEDNGPGIVRAQVPNIFGKLLYGSKFHRLRQSRGQQGIGISAAGMYAQLTTGNALRVRSKAGKKAGAYDFVVSIDTNKNKPVFSETPVEWDGKDHGTRVELDLEGEYRRGQRSVEEFMKLVAVANPHVRMTFSDPEGNNFVYERATTELPRETDEIKPHPHGVELGILIKMLHDTKEKWVSSFLQHDFSRVGPKVAQEICEKAKINPHKRPVEVAKQEADALKTAIDATRILAPPSSCIAPIGEDLIIAGLKKEVEADVYIGASRSPVVYRGHPFLVEVGIAYGRPGDTMEMEGDKIVASSKKKTKRAPAEGLMGFADEPARLIRFANRVPLLHQQSACSVTKSVIATNWKGYGLAQPRGALPIGPLVVMVHIASVWVPFTSESKEAIASYPEILKEIRLAIQDCGRKLGMHIRKGKRLEAEYNKRNYIEMYIPHIGEALRDILRLSETQTKATVEKLTDVLERSRKL